MRVQNRIYIKFETEHQIDESTSLHERQINDCTSVESTVAQVSIRQLYKCQIDSYNRRIDGYIDYFKEKYKDVPSVFLQMYLLDVPSVPR